MPHPFKRKYINTSFQPPSFYYLYILSILYSIQEKYTPILFILHCKLTYKPGKAALISCLVEICTFTWYRVVEWGGDPKPLDIIATNTGHITDTQKLLILYICLVTMTITAE